VAPPSPRHRRLLAVVALVGIWAVVTGACSSSHGSSAPPAPTVGTPTTSGNRPGPVPGYTPFFLKDGLVSPGHRRPVDPKDPLGSALRALIAGPDAVDAAAGLSTTLAPDVTIDNLTLTKGVVNVDFSRRFESANTRPQVGEVVYTMTQFAGVRAVSFMVDGTPNGAAGVGPQTRGDLADMTPPVLALAPAPADRLGRSFRCQGLTQLKVAVVCTAKAPNGRVLGSTTMALPTTTTTSTTVLGVVGANGAPSVSFDSVVTLGAPYRGPATIIVAPPKATYGVPIATVAVTFTS
jgi:hypothetical protein